MGAKGKGEGAGWVSEKFGARGVANGCTKMKGDSGGIKAIRRSPRTSRDSVGPGMPYESAKGVEDMKLSGCLSREFREGKDSIGLETVFLLRVGQGGRTNCLSSGLRWIKRCAFLQWSYPSRRYGT